MRGARNAIAPGYTRTRHPGRVTAPTIDDPAAAARRAVQPGEERLFKSCTGATFSGKVVRAAPPVSGRKSVIVEVGGRAHRTGEARFCFDEDDPLREGFSLGL